MFTFLYAKCDNIIYKFLFIYFYQTKDISIFVSFLFCLFSTRFFIYYPTEPESVSILFLLVYSKYINHLSEALACAKRMIYTKRCKYTTQELNTWLKTMNSSTKRWTQSSGHPYKMMMLGLSDRDWLFMTPSQPL